MGRPTAPDPLTLDDDAWVVATAVAGRADALVTGDVALLAAARVAPLAIVSPRGFWERLRAGAAEAGGL